MTNTKAERSTFQPNAVVSMMLTSGQFPSLCTPCPYEEIRSVVHSERLPVTHFHLPPPCNALAGNCFPEARWHLFILWTSQTGILFLNLKKLILESCTLAHFMLNIRHCKQLGSTNSTWGNFPFYSLSFLLPAGVWAKNSLADDRIMNPTDKCIAQQCNELIIYVLMDEQCRRNGGKRGLDSDIQLQ